MLYKLKKYFILGGLGLGGDWDDWDWVIGIFKFILMLFQLKLSSNFEFDLLGLLAQTGAITTLSLRLNIFTNLGLHWALLSCSLLIVLQ